MIRSLLHVPVDHGLVLGTVTAAAIGSIALMLGLRARRWGSWIAVLLVTLLAVVACGKAIGIENRVGSSFPPSFYLWAALPLATLAHGLIRSGRPARPGSLSFSAVVLLLLLGAGQVNAHYSYLPTVGDVIGAPLPDEVAARAATSLLQGPRPSTSSVGALSSRGVVLPVRIPSSSSRFEARGGYVWLPPAYFRSPRPTLPVVLMMAGVPGDPSNLLRGGHAVQAADTFAAAHDGTAPILVFPDHNGGMWTDSECVDGPRGHAETYLTVDIPAYVSHTFGTATGGASWAIMGYSEGGTCALTLALRFTLTLTVALGRCAIPSSSRHSLTSRVTSAPTTARAASHPITRWPGSMADGRPSGPRMSRCCSFAGNRPSTPPSWSARATCEPERRLEA